MNTSPRLLPALGLALLAAAAAPSVRASLTYDVEATTLNGQPLTGLNSPKNITVIPGDTLAFAVFARITGATGNPALEGFLSTVFALKTSAAGGIAANFTSRFAPAAPFDDNMNYNGVLQDLDGDGDIDLGGNANLAANYGNLLLENIALIDSHAGTMQTAGLPITDGQAFYLGAASLTIGPALPGSSITLNAFAPDYHLANGTIYGLGRASRGSWEEDGVLLNGTTGTLASGDPITLLTAAVPGPSSPEPGSLSLLALGLLGLLGTRPARPAR